MKRAWVWVAPFLVIIQVYCSVDKQRVRLVDHNEYVSVLRGNAPINDKGQFEYHELRQILQGMTKDIVHPNVKHRIYLISLLNFLSSQQTKQRYIIEHLFNKDRAQPNFYGVDRVYNRYMSYAVMGTYISPSWLPASLRKMVAKYYKYLNYDNLQALFTEMKQLMSYKYDTFIYVFSHEGLDRVGYVLGAYKMKYLNASLKQVMQQNMSVLQGHRTSMHFNCYYALQWYCMTLGRSSQECLVGENGNDVSNYQL